MEWIIVPLIGLFIAIKAGAFDSLISGKPRRKKTPKPPPKDEPWPMADRQEQPEDPPFTPINREPSDIQVKTAEQHWISTASLKRRKVKEDTSLYFKQKCLFTPTEMKFLNVLQEAVGDDYAIMGKVRMADIFGIKAPERSKEYFSHFGKIKSKHFDFVLCSKESMEPVLAIELDDSSHQRLDRIKRDSFVNRLCSDAKIQIFRRKASREYNVDDIKNDIYHIIEDIGC